jgi:tetratricopeptide (TPR) repeat protein
MDIHWTPVEYILTELRVVSRYIFLILVPLPSYMVFDYSNAYPVSRDLFHPVTTVLSLFFIASIIFLSLRYITKFPLISFGLIWYLVTISLESFIAIGLDPYFEHRNYLPSYGLFLALASLLVYTERRRITIKKEVIIPIAALLLFVLTFARNGTWSEGTLFWEDVVKKVPNSARGHLSLGFAYRTSGLADKAIEEYQTALRLKPDYAKAHNNLGLVYMSKGLTDKAAEQYRIALDLDPDYSEARSHLDDIYSPRGQSERTAEQYLRALRINPNNAEAHYALGNIFFKNKRLDEAIEHYRLSVKLKPDFVVAQYNLGVAYSYKGLRDKAIEQYRIVLKSDPGHAEARENLGIAYAEKGLIDKAIEHLKIAAALNPQNPTFRDNLTRAYQMKNPEKGTGTATKR